MSFHFQSRQYCLATRRTSYMKPILPRFSWGPSAVLVLLQHKCCNPTHRSNVTIPLTNVTIPLLMKLFHSSGSLICILLRFLYSPLYEAAATSYYLGIGCLGCFYRWVAHQRSSLCNSPSMLPLQSPPVSCAGPVVILQQLGSSVGAHVGQVRASRALATAFLPAYTPP